jgi:glycosyltransferase involved in cell wall biosynthesis
VRDGGLTPCVSVVVPTCRRPDLLARCLSALAAQDLERDAFEVVVADDAADDATRRLVEQQRAVGMTARYIPVQGAHGPAAARNVGWRAAAGGVIAFTDDDCLPTPGWLRVGLAACAAGADAVAGRVVMPLAWANCRRPTDYERNAALLAEAGFVTANCFVRRDVLAACGGFDERFEVAWREDSDLLATLLATGRHVVDAPDAVVTHLVRPAHWGVSLSQQRKSMYNALLYRKHPDFYRTRIQAAPPWRYYRIVAALVFAWVGMAVGSRRVAGGATLIWAALTGRFCAERLRHTSHAPAHVAEMVVTSALIPPLALFWRLRGAARYRVWFL